MAEGERRGEEPEGRRRRDKRSRQPQRREQRRLLWAVILFLVGVGGATVGLIYGPAAAVTGIVCLLGGVALLGLLWLILILMERLA